jgi:predicted lysophospholipase L1 biosynthesis ABC-type transport system permease subunit
MDNNRNFFEAMKLVTTLPQDMQDRFISEIRQFQRDNVFEQLSVGSIVKINHKKISPMAQFRVTKINRKNVKCQKLINGFDSSVIYTVTPSLLEVIK